MIQLFLELARQLNSSVFFLLLLFILIIFMCIWVAHKIGGWGERFLTHDTSIKSLQELSKAVYKMEGKVDLIYLHTAPNPLAASRSPLTLTPLGDEISKKIKADELVNKYLSKLTQEVESTNPKSAYDIQESSMKVAKDKMINFLDEKELIDIKQEAFIRGIPLEDILVIFGILLRNRILKEKNIPIATVDDRT